MNNIAHRIRIAAQFRGRDGVVDVFTAQPPKVWADKDVRFELAFLDEAGLAGLSNVASLTLEVYASTRDGEPFLARTLAAAALNGALTREAWDAGGANDAHAVFEFTEVETDLNLGGQLRQEFWMRVVCVTNDTPAKTYPAGSGRITFEKDGPYETNGVVQGGNTLPANAAYDAAGEYTLSGLTVDKVYKWSPGANDSDLTCGSQQLTVEGNFTAQATTALLTGTPLAFVTAIVRADVYLSAAESDGRYLRQPIVAWTATAFAQGRLATDQGGLWYCKQPTTNEAPPTLPATSNAWWLLLVAPGADGATPANGVDGEDAYLYVAFASDAAGADFSLTPSALLKYVAFKTSTAPLTPVAGDFAGLWVKYVADAPADGADGVNSFTITMADFSQPAVNSTVNIAVANSAWTAVGQNLYIASGGHYEVTAVPDATHITVKNLDVAGNADEAANVASGSKVSPGGKPASASAGDMILNAEQTVTGRKTFVDTTLAARNAANTRSTTLHSSAATADRDFYLPDKSGTAALATVASALPYAATTTVDFNGDEWRELTLTGDVTLATANRAAGKQVLVKITSSAARALSFPAWVWAGGTAPTGIGAGETRLLVLRCFGALETDVAAEWVAGGSLGASELVINATGSTDITPAHPIHSKLITVTDTYGGGTFTHTLYLAAAGHNNGDRLFARFILPASTDPTLEVRTPDAAGTVLIAFTSLMLISELWADFVVTNGAWTLEKFEWRTSDGAPAQNLFTRGTVTYAAAVAIDLDGPSVQEITATGDLELSTLSASRAGVGRAKDVSLIILASGAACAITFGTGIKGIGDTLPSGKTAAIAIRSRGANETDTIAAYAQLD